MAKSLNKVMAIGRLGRDPELKYLPNGDPTCSFSIAVDRPKREGQGDKTDWLRCSAWGKLAEICGQYLSKGSKVYVEGSLLTSDRTNQLGVKEYFWEIRVRDMLMLDGAKRAEAIEELAAVGAAAGVEGEPDDMPF